VLQAVAGVPGGGAAVADRPVIRVAFAGWLIAVVGNGLAHERDAVGAGADDDLHPQAVGRDGGPTAIDDLVGVAVRPARRRRCAAHRKRLVRILHNRAAPRHRYIVSLHGALPIYVLQAVAGVPGGGAAV